MIPVKVGVIGAGYWGPNLIRNFNELQEADLQIVCDLNQERLDHISKLYPEIHTHKNYREILESDIEAVAIATPVSTHSRIALDCLSAGKHVLIEKPLACTSLEAQEIIEAGQMEGKVVMTGHTFVYNPAVIALKEIIASGEIGEVYYISSTRGNLGLYQPDINVLWDLAPHDVSILLYTLDLEPRYASARGGMYVKKGVHDMANMTVYFEKDVIADLRVSWLDPCKIRCITIVGSKKMIVYDDIEPVEKLKIYDKGVDVQPYNDTLEEFHLAYRYGEMTSYPLDWQEPLKVECQQYLNSIRTGEPTPSSGIEGLKVVQVLEAAQKSLFNGGIQEVIKWEAPIPTPA
jgi:predicted dehydrogenase